jgi:hypothetical protein
MYRVFTTSTGEATTVAQKPAPKAETKWQGKLSEEGKGDQGWSALVLCSCVFTVCSSSALTLSTSHIVHISHSAQG